MPYIKQIVVEHGLRKQIMAVFDVSYPTVRVALKYGSNSITAQNIRQYALDNGGVLTYGIIG